MHAQVGSVHKNRKNLNFFESIGGPDFFGVLKFLLKLKGPRLIFAFWLF